MVHPRLSFYEDAMYHNMTVKFHIPKGHTVAPLIAAIKKDNEDVIDQHDFHLNADMDEIGHIIISREDVMDNNTGVTAAIQAAVTLALRNGDQNKVIRVFSRTESDGDDEGQYTLVCRNKDVLLKAGYVSYIAELEALTKKLRDLPQHIEQFPDLDAELVGESEVLKLEVNDDNIENHQL